MERDRGGACKRVHTCEWCGHPFYASRRHARFHSVKCRVAYHRFMQHRTEPTWQEENKSRQLSFILNGEIINA